MQEKNAVCILAPRNSCIKNTYSEAERGNQSENHSNLDTNAVYSDKERDEVVLVNDTTAHNNITFEQRVENLKRIAEKLNMEIDLSNFYS